MRKIHALKLAKLGFFTIRVLINAQNATIYAPIVTEEGIINASNVKI